MLTYRRKRYRQSVDMEISGAQTHHQGCRRSILDRMYPPLSQASPSIYSVFHYLNSVVSYRLHQVLGFINLHAILSNTVVSFLYTPVYLPLASTLNDHYKTSHIHCRIFSVALLTYLSLWAGASVEWQSCRSFQSIINITTLWVSQIPNNGAHKWLAVQMVYIIL